MTMLEKMARALCKADRFDPDARAYPGAPAAWERYSERCRAVLDAIREPTEALVADACRSHTPGQPMSRTAPEECPAFERRREAWRNMVDAIREERA